MGIYLNDDELLALSNSSGLAVKVYLRLRSRMDLRTRLVGVMSGISWPALIEWTETTIPRGRGVQVEKPSESAVRRATEALERVGLVQKRPSAVLVFLLPMASGAEVRPNQTRQKPDRGLSTAPDTAGNQHLSGFAGGFEGESGTHDEAEKDPNPAHIRGRGFNPSQSSSTDSTGVDCDGASSDDAARGGVNRDRPAGSQAGSLRRPGKTQANPDRDRPAASHPALPGRSGSGARRCGDFLPASMAPNVETSAARGAEALDDGSALAGNESALRAALGRHGIRVPATATQPGEWAGRGVTPLELDTAVEKVRAALAPRTDVPLKYLGKTIYSLRAEAKAAEARAKAKAAAPAQPTAWQRDIEVMAKKLGMWPSRQGESWEGLRQRVLRAAGDGFGAGLEQA